MAVTRFGLEGYGVRRAGSFAGKAQPDSVIPSLVVAGLVARPVLDADVSERPALIGVPIANEWVQ